MKTVDIIALIVTIVVSIVLIVPLFQDNISEEGKKIYEQVIIAFVSLLQLYIGYKLGQKIN